MADTRSTELLFSYGTLQLESVQMATFGRRLAGRPDTLPGFAQSTLEIRDEATVVLSGTSQHNIVRFTGRPSDAVSGVLFEITPAELERADEYEVSDYKRVSVVLGSGVRAWVYVDAKD